MGKKPKRGRSVKNNPNVHTEPENLTQAPHSFVIQRGLPSGDSDRLTRDFRRVMEPFTASSLKAHRKNTIKDFVAIAGPLHVSHLSIFSQTELGLYLKICTLPRGPTITFKVTECTLSSDVISSLKKQNFAEVAFKHSPLVVSSSFNGHGPHLKLVASIFQNMFPTLNVTNVELSTVRRCVLFHYDSATNLISFRHFQIKCIPVGVSKGVKKVIQGKVPNLQNYENISEFFTKSGMLSESEFEDDSTNQVTLPQKLTTRGNMEGATSSIKLSELGPRLTLQLIKVEDGLLDGEVLYHNHIEKTDEEKIEIQKKREAKKKLKENRKKIQAKNKEVKEKTKQELKEKSLQGMKKADPEDEQLQDRVKETTEEPEDDDAEYYRQEVGEEPDRDLFTRSQKTSRPPKTPHFYKNKRKWDESNENNPSRTNKRFKKNATWEDSNKKKVQRPNKRFTKNDRTRDKTNSHNRDHRPIGGKVFKTKAQRNKK